MSLSATARSVPGTLRQWVGIGPHAFLTDQPVRDGGEGCGPSPHELVPAALAACVAFTITAYARTKHWDLGVVSVTVDYDPHSTPRRCFTRIVLEHDVTHLQLVRLRKVAAACPVRRTLEAGCVFDDCIEAADGIPSSPATSAVAP